MITQLIVFDLLGTFAFAAYGGYLAMKKQFDLFGISICAILTATGGGIIRDVIVGRLPVVFSDARYALIIVLAIGLIVISKQRFERWRNLFLAMDAIGLVTFSYIGASVGIEYNVGFIGTVTLGTVTAVGGGVLRDIVLRVEPEIMHRDIYASVSIVLSSIFAAVYAYNPALFGQYWFIYATLGFGLVCRFIVIRYTLNLWRPAS